MRIETVISAAGVARISLAVALIMWTQAAYGQSAKGPVPDLTGTYEVVPNSATVPGGLKNVGSPEEISVQPGAAAKLKTIDLSPDPAKTCQPIGPFRMMAREGNKIEVLPSLSNGKIFILFEDYFVGFFRQIYLDQPHLPKKELPDRDPGQGDSVGHWEGDTLVVDTVNFNEFTWLNAKGVPHSDDLHLIERYRLVGNGQYLEVKVTAEDPKILAKPYGYTRYFQRTNTEIEQYVCTDDLVTPPIPQVN
jgi:hypothetical protein